MSRRMTFMRPIEIYLPRIKWRKKKSEREKHKRTQHAKWIRVGCAKEVAQSDFQHVDYVGGAGNGRAGVLDRRIRECRD